MATTPSRNLPRHFLIVTAMTGAKKDLKRNIIYFTLIVPLFLNISLTVSSSFKLEKGGPEASVILFSTKMVDITLANQRSELSINNICFNYYLLIFSTALNK